jgi:CSLREA domain-containing protein
MRSRIGFSGRMSVTTRRVISSFVLAAPAILGVLAPTTPVHAATTINVTTTADELTNNGKCSLREAIRASNLRTSVDSCAAGVGNDTIVVGAGVYDLTVGGELEDAAQTGDLDVLGRVVIRGAGVTRTVVRDRSHDRVFDVRGGALATIEQLTVRDGGNPESDIAAGGGIANAGDLTLRNVSVTANAAPLGGGIVNKVGGTMRLITSVVEGNTAVGHCGTKFGCADANGAGIFNAGTLLASNSTVSGNRGSASSAQGGGIYNVGTVELVNVTVAFNFAGGGLCFEGRCQSSGSGGLLNTGTARITSTIIARNTAVAERHDQGPPSLEPPPPLDLTPVDRDCSGSLESHGSNLIGTSSGCSLTGVPTGNQIGVDAGLGALQDNGGPTLTHALLPGSPAIDAVVAGICPATDQRGIPRPQDGNLDGLAVCDIGAFEVQPPVTFASLCTLSRQLVTNATLAKGMCTTLDAAQRSNDRGLPKEKAKLLSTYAGQVDTAQRIGVVTADQALRLKRLAVAL